MLNQILNLPKKLFQAHPKGQEPMTVYYDGGCGPCSTIADFTDRIDLGNNLRWEPNYSAEADEVFKDMPLEQRFLSVKAVTADGIVFEGARAMLEAACHLPVFGPLAYVFKNIPGQEKGTEPMYAWVAARRPTTCKLK